MRRIGGSLLTRSIAIALLGWLWFGQAGCASLGIGSHGVDRIQSTGQIRVAMAGDYPPLNAQTIDGRLVGLDADLAGALAAILNVELVLVQKPLAELLDAVRSGEVDLAISGLTMTPERNLQVAFAGPYYLARKSLLGSPDTLEGVSHVRDLAGRGLTVAAIAGGTSEGLVRRVLPNSEHVFVPSHDDAIARVLDGSADVLVADDPIARYALIRHPSAGLSFVESEKSAEPIGIAIAPDDPLFVNLVENYLSNLEHIGLLDQLRQKWFESDDWLLLLP